MINVSKVVLINWMYFQKATFNLDGNAAIVGVNGTGKSTIIDAIQMLILGNKASHFNANANAEKRTLESYVRGAVLTEEKDYLRPGDVITYLAMEVNLNDKKHILGICMEYKYNLSKLSDPRYFYLKEVDLDESLFIKDSYPIPYSEFNKCNKKLLEEQFITFPTLQAYQAKIKDIFGLKDEKKYFQILSRAVGIKNIDDCNTFMNSFVLDESNIDVSSIKNNIIEMEKISKTIEREQLKLDLLTEITDKGNMVTKNISIINENTNKINIANSILISREIEKLETEIERDRNLIDSIDNNMRSLEDSKINYVKSKEELEKMLEEISPNLSAKESELKKIESEHYNANLHLNTFKTNCRNQLGSLVELKRYNNSCFNNFISFIKHEEYTTATAKNEFLTFRKEASTLKDKYNEKVIAYEFQLKEIQEQLLELQGIIKQLENNTPVYDPKLIQFVEYLRKALHDKYHKDIEVKFLCDYLDILNNEWRNAIEGYLDKQRFYIVVPNEYYKDALKLYNEKKDFYATKIINGLRLPQQDFEEGTLGEFITATNSIALNYARYLLNRVHYVADYSELDNFNIAITKECMLYQGYATGRINPRAYSVQYIGSEGIKNQLEYRRNQFEEVNHQANIILEERNKCKGCYNELEYSVKFVSDILENNYLIDSIDLEQKLFERIEQLTEEIQFYKSNPQYIDISDNISSVEKKIESIKNKLSKLTEEKVELLSRIKTNNEKITEKKKFREFYDELIFVMDERYVLSIKNELESINLSYNYIKTLESNNKGLERSNDKLILEIENKMEIARNNFSINAAPNFNSLSVFVEEKNKINQAIFNYKSKIVNMKENNKKLFFTQFLTKLNNSIEKAKKEIEGLNHSLSLFRFGNDKYKIKMSNSGNTDLQIIYEYAVKYSESESERGLFNFDQQDIERERIQKILNQYMFSDDVKVQQLIIDYRNYLHFDVEVITPNGTKSLNKVIKSQSGGEVQVPFYILTGVAFQQTLDYKRRKDDVLGIVLFDEAFDKMDSQRINSMLTFYREKLNIQLIIATPGKLESLVDNMETIVAVIRDGETAIVSDLSHDLR